jgi:hypothetical protein
MRARMPARRTLGAVTTDQIDVAKAKTHGPDFALFIVIGVALLVLAALFPAARAIDAHFDSKRPFYDDVSEMAWIQYNYYQLQGEAYPIEVQSGQSVTVGDQTYAVSPGVELAVRATEDGWCIKGHDDHGNSGDWCFAGDVDPGNPN